VLEVFLEELKLEQWVTIFAEFCGPEVIPAVFTESQHCTLSRSNQIQFALLYLYL